MKRRMGIWYEIKPKTKREHPWLFAQYLETPSERGDGQWYVAFLFRDRERTAFGIREFIGRLFEGARFHVSRATPGHHHLSGA